MKLEKIMTPDWALKMADVADEIGVMGDFLRAEVAAGRRYLPAPENIFRAFRTPLADVKVLIVGQDPYPDPKYPIGLSFAVNREVRPIPQSLRNIYTEMINDVGGELPEHGDLSHLAEQGVMLLNRALTVQAGMPASHSGKGWERITEQAIKVLNDRDQPMVAILWGNSARQLKERLTSPKIQILESPHPSPLSASRGFFGSKPFSKANLYLTMNGIAPIRWL